MVILKIFFEDCDHKIDKNVNYLSYSLISNLLFVNFLNYFYFFIIKILII